MIKHSLFNLDNTKSTQKKSIFLVVLLVFIALLLSSMVFLYKNINDCSNCIYNQDGIKITKKEYNEALDERRIFYEFTNQDFNAETLEADIKNQLIEVKKLQEIAEENNIKVSDEEVRRVYDERIKQSGSEEKLLETINKMYGYDKQKYLNQIEKDLLLEKASQIKNKK